MSSNLLYEHPLTEKMRLFLRIEQLINNFHTACRDSSNWHTQCAIHGLIDLHEVTSRLDMRADLVREIERIIGSLEKLEQIEKVNQDRLSTVVHKLQSEIVHLLDGRGPLDSHLKSHELFNALKQQRHKQGGMNLFDLPQFTHWINQPADTKMAMLRSWISPYDEIYRTINLILNLTRESGKKSDLTAKQGYYEQSLDHGVTHQLLRLWVPEVNHNYPAISSGKHRLSIRFMHLDNMADRAKQISEDQDFQLMVCIL